MAGNTDPSYIAYCPKCHQGYCVVPSWAGTVWQCKECGHRFRIPFDWGGTIFRAAVVTVMAALLGLSLLCCQGMSCMVRYHDAHHPAH